MYCLVVTNDYSRFTWVFFLGTKDETSGTLKSFIARVENLMNLRIKVIRCDNGTEFKNREMNQFCEVKGIMRQYSVGRTPQQNRFVERRNRTLIEAARTMLADSKLLTTFWAKAVNTACYVQNRVLVTKPHNKTPYELFHSRTPVISFLRPFGCPVTILNTIDHIGKFDGKADEGFFVGYSLNSKAFRVFNSRTRIVEENLHVKFSENTPDNVGSRPNWLFDIDALTKTMNYQLVVAQSNAFLGGRTVLTALTELILLLQISSGVNVVGTNISIDLPPDPNMSSLEDIGIFKDSHDNEDVFGAEADFHNLDSTFQVCLLPTTRIYKDHPLEKVIRDLHLAPQTRRMTKNLKEHGLIDVKKVSTPIETSKPLLKDKDGEEVDTVVANSTTLAEYVAALSCCGQVFLIQNQLLDYGVNAAIDVVKVSAVKHDLKLNDVEGTSCLSTAVIFKELARMGFIQVFVNHQLGDMSYYKGIFVNPSFTKKVFANMKRVGTGFPEEVTPLFGTMMVQVVKEVGALPTDVQDTPIPDAPSSSQPQRKHKPRRKERKKTEVSLTEIHTEDHVPTTFNDPLLSGEDRMQLKVLIDLYTNLSNKVLDLENEVIDMKSLHKVKLAKLESMGRKIANIDADADVNLENVIDDVVKEVAKKMVEVMKVGKIIVDEVSTVGGELNAANEKPVGAAPTNITTAQPSEATKTIVDITTAPKAKGIVFHDKEESTTRTVSSKSQAKDKGKAKLIEKPEIQKSRKAQITIDEEVARRIEAEWNADMKDNIDWNEVVKQVQSRQSDAVRKYQALKRKHVSVAQVRKNMMIYLKNMVGYKTDFFKGMSYEEDFVTRQIILRCDSSGDLYPVTQPSPIPHALSILLCGTNALGIPGKKYKARLIANGRKQQYGVDCSDTLSSVVKPATICMVLSLALTWNLPVHQLDVKNELLNGYALRVGFYSSRCDSSLFIYRHAKRQHTLSRSSAKAEYKGVANVVAETAWISNLLRELHTPLLFATLVYCANAKHIEIDIHFVRDMVARGQVLVLHVPSRYQYADIFIKGLPFTPFEEFHTSLSVLPSPAQTAKEC
nr:putative ribonuclease H-like domain-containing protein [Tanacetum cinerariifolium]